MANQSDMVVRLDKNSLDAINQLRKAVEKQNQIAKKNGRPFEVRSARPGETIRLSETPRTELGEAAR